MNHKPQILVLLGSPRKNKNSETLVDSFLEPLRQSGCPIVKVRVPDLNIKHCTGCEACQKSGACILNDDMPQVYEALDQADWVVLVSPMYFNSVTGSLKLLIDRCQIYWARKFVLKKPPLKPKRFGFLLMSAGIAQTPEMLNGSWRVADYFFKAQDITFMDTLCLDRTDSGDNAYFQTIHEQAAEMAARALGSIV